MKPGDIIEYKKAQFQVNFVNDEMLVGFYRDHKRGYVNVVINHIQTVINDIKVIGYCEPEEKHELLKLL